MANRKHSDGRCHENYSSDTAVDSVLNQKIERLSQQIGQIRQQREKNVAWFQHFQETEERKRKLLYLKIPRHNSKQDKNVKHKQEEYYAKFLDDTTQPPDVNIQIITKLQAQLLQCFHFIEIYRKQWKLVANQTFAIAQTMMHQQKMLRHVPSPNWTQTVSPKQTVKIHPYKENDFLFHNFRRTLNELTKRMQHEPFLLQAYGNDGTLTLKTSRRKLNGDHDCPRPMKKLKLWKHMKRKTKKKRTNEKENTKEED
mmetsp:Transcript_17044/g.25803  ORF Transcript_17044/g.25803 Transcript_17044/m.25803 type:complete len:255 (+) Transcript_17044:223-987(+)